MSLEQSQPFEPLPATEVAEIIAREERFAVHDNHRAIAAGAGLIAASAAIAFGAVAGLHDGGSISHELPFDKKAQTVIENVDRGFEALGFALPILGVGIASVKIAGARGNTRLRTMDKWSSKELIDDGTPSKNILRRAAHRAPWIAISGVALSTLTAGVATEVGQGSSGPIDSFTQFAPGVPITEYGQAMPMVESNVNPKLSARIQQIAQDEGVSSHVLDLNLGAFRYNGQTYTDLSIGTKVPETSPVAWRGQSTEDCYRVTIPVMIDKAARVPVGSDVVMNGMTVRNVGELSGMSSMNRTGIAISGQALKTCIEQNPDAPDHAVTLETSETTAQKILDKAQESVHAPAVVEPLAEYKAQSTEFWNANVKPITSLQEIAAAGMALVAMAGAMGERLLRNRSQWAGKLANGVTRNQLRATELLRSAKDAMLASTIGVAVGIAPTISAGLLESGFQPGVGAKEALIGAGVGVTGTVLGGLTRLLRLRQTINPDEHTRG